MDWSNHGQDLNKSGKVQNCDLPEYLSLSAFYVQPGEISPGSLATQTRFLFQWMGKKFPREAKKYSNGESGLEVCFVHRLFKTAGEDRIRVGLSQTVCATNLTGQGFCRLDWSRVTWWNCILFFFLVFFFWWLLLTVAGWKRWTNLVGVPTRTERDGRRQVISFSGRPGCSQWGKCSTRRLECVKKRKKEWKKRGGTGKEREKCCAGGVKCSSKSSSISAGAG